MLKLILLLLSVVVICVVTAEETSVEDPSEARFFWTLFRKPTEIEYLRKNITNLQKLSRTALYNVRLQSLRGHLQLRTEILRAYTIFTPGDKEKCTDGLIKENYNKFRKDLQNEIDVCKTQSMAVLDTYQDKLIDYAQDIEKLVPPKPDDNKPIEVPEEPVDTNPDPVGIKVNSSSEAKPDISTDVTLSVSTEGKPLEENTSSAAVAEVEGISDPKPLEQSLPSGNVDVTVAETSSEGKPLETNTASKVEVEVSSEGKPLEQSSTTGNFEVESVTSIDAKPVGNVEEKKPTEAVEEIKPEVESNSVETKRSARNDDNEIEQVQAKVAEARGVIKTLSKSHQNCVRKVLHGAEIGERNKFHDILCKPKGPQ